MDLQKDQHVYVRAALSDNILSLCPSLGPQASKQHILPIFLLLFRDKSSEVRLKLFSRLDDLNSVISIEELQLSLIPSLEELAIEKDWRLKMQVIDYFPMLARQLGEQFFNDKLNAICTRWLSDHFFAIRQAAILNFN